MRLTRQTKFQKTMIVLIDNGHGANTAGKRSPDGRLLEYAYTREIAGRLFCELKKRGYNAELIVKEDVDVPLSERVRRVNDICKREGAKNVLLVSIHVNASGNGEWGKAQGWSVYTSKGRTKADKLATYLYKVADEVWRNRKVRKDLSDGDEDWENDFYILKKTACASVLTENFFMDNADDVNYLLSAEGKRAVVDVHTRGIINFIKEIGQ